MQTVIIKIRQPKNKAANFAKKDIQHGICRHSEKIKRCFFIWCNVLSMLFIIGSVGAFETDGISLGQAIIQSAIGFIIMKCLSKNCDGDSE